MKIKMPLIWLFASSLFSCSDPFLEESTSIEIPINILGNIEQEYLTRVNDAGFTDGDQMGVFVVDYINGVAGELTEGGNRANNVSFTLNGETNRWVGASTIYWKDANTAIDCYGYYPYENSIESVTKHSFTIEPDQSDKSIHGNMNGYEKSDFLWAKATNVQPTKNTIKLNYTHIMSGIKVVLQQGSGFNGDEWDRIEHIVSVDGTSRKASINLSTGDIIAEGAADKSIIAADQDNDTYRAVIVPQTVTAGSNLIGMTIDGTAYHYAIDESISFISGKMYTFTLKVDKRSSGDYSLTLISQSISSWENDNSSHNFESVAYTVINCPIEGTLSQCIADTEKKPENIRNLKITGRLNSIDFEFIRNNMTVLQGLNLNDVITCGMVSQSHMTNICQELKEFVSDSDVDNVLPHMALKGKLSLKHLLLPKTLKIVGKEALSDLDLAYNSTLIIPNSVIALDDGALNNLANCSIQMPDSLICIGSNAMANQTARYDIKLPATLKYIGEAAFMNSQKVTGQFNLPADIEYIGPRAFDHFGSNLTGRIIIPRTLTTVPDNAFSAMDFANAFEISLHANIEEIGSGAFSRYGSGWYGTTPRDVSYIINNNIQWPSNLRKIGDSAFEGCVFRGGISPLPESIVFIGSYAFQNSSIPDYIKLPESISSISRWLFLSSDIKTIEIPNNVEYISEQAFYGCENLQSVKIGKFVEDIDNEAFARCRALADITCLSPEPPVLGNNVFDWCDMDHLILQVPEGSVDKYRNADGWRDIKYITAYHELAVSLKKITCLDKGITRDMIVRSEGEWEITQCPNWCHVSKTSSNTNTTEITISVDSASGNRNGTIEFTLKGKNYTTACDIEQYVASEKEDKEIVLQEASAGATPIPIFIVGDGFSAEQIADGTYLKLCNEQMEHFFAIEPYKTYRDYFTVTTSLAVSPDKGISTVENIIENKFESTNDPAVGLRCNYDLLSNYAKERSEFIDEQNINNALIMVIMNTETFDGNYYIAEDGMTIGMTTISPDEYPYDTRGLVQHYIGGRGFGRLASEQINHIDYIKQCNMCDAYNQYMLGKTQGWYKNVSTNNSVNNVPWSHLIFDPRYSDIVDVYEGGFNHSRGIFRSEPRSCMSEFIQYYNTYSRELIVRRIMELSGQTFDFELFAQKDSRDGLPE